jgi:hypothetical protein
MAKETIEEMVSIPESQIMHDADELVVAPNEFNNSHLEAIRYAARFMRYKGYHDESEELLLEAGIETVPVYDIEDSEFIKRLQEEGIRPQLQGFLTAGTGRDAIRYPIVVLHGDIMRYEMFYQKLKHTLREEFEAELQNDDS